MTLAILCRNHAKAPRRRIDLRLSVPAAAVHEAVRACAMRLPAAEEEAEQTDIEERQGKERQRRDNAKQKKPEEDGEVKKKDLVTIDPDEFRPRKALLRFVPP